jgi:hypothetical protein
MVLTTLVEVGGVVGSGADYDKAEFHQYIIIFFFY